MTRYYFEIISTIDTSDHSDKIKAGDVLYGLDEDTEFFATEKEAIDEGDKILVGLDGGGAFNLALESAEVIAKKQNIRMEYLDLENDQKEELAAGNFGFAKEIDRMMQELLQKMTAEQRSWVLDDHAEIPNTTFKEMMEKIKEQEQS